MYIFELSVGGLHIAPTWYGLMYALGFSMCYLFLGRYFRFSKKEDLDTLLTYVFVGLLLGGRLGYIILYNPLYFFEHPIDMLKVWQGGMSFHGGCLGTILAVALFSYRYRYHFWSLIDTLAVIIPVALGRGRIGNWINGELPGYTPYDGIFPMYIAGVAHFPSPLFEMLLEGVILFLVLWTLWIYSRDQIGSRLMSGAFLIGYALCRLTAEQYRLPDAHIGYLYGTDWLTLGIVYSIPMLVYGGYLISGYIVLKKRKD